MQKLQNKAKNALPVPNLQIIFHTKFHQILSDFRSPQKENQILTDFRLPVHFKFIDAYISDYLRLDRSVNSFK